MPNQTCLCSIAIIILGHTYYDFDFKHWSGGKQSTLQRKSEEKVIVHVKNYS